MRTTCTETVCLLRHLSSCPLTSLPFSDDTSPAFEEFLTLLGDKVELVNHQGYAGGLSTKGNSLRICNTCSNNKLLDDSTGTHCVYTQFHNFEIVFHVANLIPIPNPDVDTQRVARKRHLGNDVVLIIFKDGSPSSAPVCVPLMATLQRQTTHRFRRTRSRHTSIVSLKTIFFSLAQLLQSLTGAKTFSW
jgi:hypothetical protein